MGLLGLGDYQVIAQTRGGTRLLDILSYASLRFSRRLDEVSDASAVVVAGSSPCLGELDAWKHELNILRNGGEAWVGPLIAPQYEPETVTLSANDVFFWFERRLLDQQDRNFKNQDAGEIFGIIINDALTRDNSAKITVAASATGIPASRSYKAAERLRAADVLRELARTAIDFTTICRIVRCGGVEVPNTVAFTLVDDTLRGPRLSVLGEDMAGEATVLGANVGGRTIAGRVGGATTDYGLVQQSYSESLIQDPASAQVAAQSRWNFGSVPPMSLSGVLSPDAPVDFDELIPGCRVHVELSSLDRIINADFRLSQVDVTVSPSDQGMQEEVAVTLEPIGTTVTNSVHVPADSAVLS